MFESAGICEYLDETHRAAPASGRCAGAGAAPRLDRVRIDRPRPDRRASTTRPTTPRSRRGATGIEPRCSAALEAGARPGRAVVLRRRVPPRRRRIRAGVPLLRRVRPDRGLPRLRQPPANPCVARGARAPAIGQRSTVDDRLSDAPRRRSCGAATARFPDANALMRPEGSPRAARRRPRRRRSAQLAHPVRRISASSDASVSASSIGLSVRQRSIRGKRVAMPDLWRVDRWMPSKPSSNTCVGRTLRTGPNFSIVVFFTIASTFDHLVVGEPRVRLRERDQRARLGRRRRRARSHTANVKSVYSDARRPWPRCA